MRQYKRILCVLLLSVLLATLTAPALAATPAQTQKVTLAIPCTVTVDVGEHGSLSADGRTWTGAVVDAFRVWPGTELSFRIAPASGYTVSSLTLSGTNVLSELEKGVYSVRIDHDETLVVRFTKGASPTPTPKPVWPFGPKTGDESRVGLWTAVLILSAGAVLVTCRVIRRHRAARKGVTPERGKLPSAERKTKD